MLHVTAFHPNPYDGNPLKQVIRGDPGTRRPGNRTDLRRQGLLRPHKKQEPPGPVLAPGNPDANLNAILPALGRNFRLILRWLRPVCWTATFSEPFSRQDALVRRRGNATSRASRVGDTTGPPTPWPE